MNHDQFREIFRIIDESIWEIINMRYSDDELAPLGKRISLMDRYCEDAKKILSEYIDRSSERMRRLLDSDAFKRFPAPIASESLPTAAIQPHILTAAEIGARIRAARKSAKKSLQDIANELGCSIAAFSRYERGVRPIRSETLQEVARILNIPVSDIFSP